MNRCSIRLVGMSLLFSCSLTAWSEAPESTLVSPPAIEADASQRYELSAAEGPWMIFATSFRGEGAELQAHQLVIYLRAELGLLAFVFQRSFDFSEPVEGRGLNRNGGSQRMRHSQSKKFEEFAVLVGNFHSVDEIALEKSLHKIKNAKPPFPMTANRKAEKQSFSISYGPRYLTNADDDSHSRRPLGQAFVTRNPLAPLDHEVSGVDPFVMKLNAGVEHSALQIAGKYSVKVATFGGLSTLPFDETEDANPRATNKLDEAAEMAHRLTAALREQGVEAYEFHDRHESLVTVGSFDSIGEPRADGKTEINPNVLRLMKRYGAKRQSLPGQTADGLLPRTLKEIPFDVQPIPVQIPKVSLGTKYARQE